MSDEKVFHLVYVSAATHPLDKADLLQMLREARERNQQLGVTGLLLYKDGDFIQLLEGDKATVKALFQDSIRKAPRHRNIQVLIEDEAPKRLFADWSVNRHPIVSTNRHPKVSTRSDGFRLISPLFEPERIVTRFQNFTVMGKPVQQGRRHLGITEHSDPFAKR